MKILVIGGGGREHALVWKLAQSSRATQIWCAPGNAGIGGETLAANGSVVECVGIGAEDLPALLKKLPIRSWEVLVRGGLTARAAAEFEGAD